MMNYGFIRPGFLFNLSTRISKDMVLETDGYLSLFFKTAGKVNTPLHLETLFIIFLHKDLSYFNFPFENNPSTMLE